MLKTILAFIKAHTIATAITTTVVVSTVVATPIIINQVQKQPEQEVAQVQENIIDNSVVGNTTIEENTETPEENTVEENTTVPKEEQKVETPKETKPNNTETPKKDVPQTTTKPDNNSNFVGGYGVEEPTQNKFNKDTMVEFHCYTKGTGSSLGYDPKNQLYYYLPYPDPRGSKQKWLSEDYPELKKSRAERVKYARETDIDNGIFCKDYCLQKSSEFATSIHKYQEAIEYYKLHKDEIQVSSGNTFLYKGVYYEANIEVAEGYIKNLEKEKAQWDAKYNSAPQYRARGKTS